MHTESGIAHVWSAPAGFTPPSATPSPPLPHLTKQQGGGGVVRKWVVPHLHETLYVGYAEPGNEYGILFTFSLFCEYYVRVHVIYRVNQAEYGIHILVVAPQECVNICSTRRYATRGEIG